MFYDEIQQKQLTDPTVMLFFIFFLNDFFYWTNDVKANEIRASEIGANKISISP